MTYANFLFFFLIVPTALLAAITWLLRSRGFLKADNLGYHWKGVGILVVIAFVWTTPWDNYLIARGVWDSPDDRIIGRIFYVPIEEYAFFILMPLFNGSLIYLLSGQLPNSASTWRLPQWRQRAIAAIWGGLLFSAGLYALLHERGTYLGLILVWFIPPVMIQWLFDPAALVRGWRIVFLGTMLPLLYFGLVDSYAIQQGTWKIAAASTTGIGFPQIPMEELLFFGITSLLLAQGLVLWHSLRSRDVAL